MSSVATPTTTRTAKKHATAAPVDLGDLLPPELVLAIARKFTTARQLITSDQLCKTWRSAVSWEEREELWGCFCRARFPRVAQVLLLCAEPKHGLDRWMELYKTHLRAEQVEAAKVTVLKRSLRDHVFRAELWLDGEMKASATARGLDVNLDEIQAQESVTEPLQLWTQTPDWYTENVDAIQAKGSDEWDNRLELIVYVSRMEDSYGDSMLRTGKLLHTDIACIDQGETNFDVDGEYTPQGEPVWSMRGLLFATNGEAHCGRLKLSCESEDLAGENHFSHVPEKVGTGLARLIEAAFEQSEEGSVGMFRPVQPRR